MHYCNLEIREAYYCSFKKALNVCQGSFFSFRSFCKLKSINHREGLAFFQINLSHKLIKNTTKEQMLHFPMNFILLNLYFSLLFCLFIEMSRISKGNAVTTAVLGVIACALGLGVAISSWNLMGKVSKFYVQTQNSDVSGLTFKSYWWGGLVVSVFLLEIV